MTHHSIRRAVEGDAAQLLSVAHAAYSEYLPRMGGLRPVPMDDDYVAAIAESTAWVAEAPGGRIVAFVIVRATHDSALLENVAVLPEMRGKGLGFTVARHRGATRPSARQPLHSAVYPRDDG